MRIRLGRLPIVVSAIFNKLTSYCSFVIFTQLSKTCPEASPIVLTKDVTTEYSPAIDGTVHGAEFRLVRLFIHFSEI